MARLYGAQRLVLRAIQDSPKDTAGFVTDAQVARATGIALKDVRDWIETLEVDGYVEVARTEAGLSASVTAKGRLFLRLFEAFSAKETDSQDSAPNTEGTSSSRHTEDPRSVSREAISRGSADEDEL